MVTASKQYTIKIKTAFREHQKLIMKENSLLKVILSKTMLEITFWEWK